MPQRTPTRPPTRMLNHELVLTIEGVPAPKGSMKCIGGKGRRHQLIEDNVRTKPWREAVAAAVRRLTQADIHPPRADEYQPIGVEVTFAFHRPASHYGTGRATLHTVKPTAPRYPTMRTVGDVDKLARLILDAVQDTDLLPDDAQVVELVSRKVWTDAISPDIDPGARPDFLSWDRIEHAGIVLRIYPIT